MVFAGFVVLAAVLLLVVFGGGAGLVVLAPVFLVFKLGFLLMVFASFSRRAGWAPVGSRALEEERTRSGEGSVPKPSREEFDEWHRLRHARDEVDGWIEEVQ